MTDPVSVEAIYKSVIEDTIYKLSPEFENAGVSMQVLSRLQQVRRRKEEEEDEEERKKGKSTFTGVLLLYFRF